MSETCSLSSSDIGCLTNKARACVGNSTYRLKADTASAPLFVDCSSFTQWLFLQSGIRLPRLAYQQFEHCTHYLPVHLAQSGDLLFWGGGHYHAYQSILIGHVGFVTTEKTVIHAASRKSGVVETASVEAFCAHKSNRLCTGRVTQGVR